MFLCRLYHFTLQLNADGLCYFVLYITGASFLCAYARSVYDFHGCLRD